MKMILKKKPRYVVLFIHLCYFIFTASFSIILFFEPNMDIVTPICILFVSSWFLDGLIWEIFGKEVFAFEESEFRYKRSGRIYPRTTNIKYEYIYDITLEKMSFSGKNSFGFFFGTKGGHIRIDYFVLGNDEWPYSFYFGESVSYEQAQKIIRIINNQKDSCLNRFE